MQKFNKLFPEASKKRQTDTQPSKTKSGINLYIDEISLRDSQSIVFNDDSLDVPMKLGVEIKVLKINPVDTDNVSQMSHLVLSMVTQQHGRVNLEGDVQLMAETRDVDITGNLVGIDLRPVGVYLKQGFGHRIKSGQLNADIKIIAKGGKLDGLFDLDFKHLKLKSLSKEEKEQTKKDLGIGLPLDLALDMLRDKDNSIKLKVPVTGDIDNFKLDPSDALYKATSKALTAAVINYYTPFGLVTLAEGIYDLATALHFEPINFDHGDSELGPDQLINLDKIVSMMTERPKIVVSICGFVNFADLDMITEQESIQLNDFDKGDQLDEDKQKRLLQLAENRSENVKVYLVEKGIDASRLVLCAPEYKNKGHSKVVISL